MTSNLPVPRGRNPLATRRDEPPPYDPVQRLHDHVAQLNNYSWVVSSGKLYFAASRTKADGSIEHFVDRHI